MSNLQSTESLDRASPDLWPEKGPILPLHNSTVSAWQLQINEDDAVMLHELASLTSAQLKDKIDCLLKLSYQLGMQESHEMTRGKFLNVLPKEL